MTFEDVLAEHGIETPEQLQEWLSNRIALTVAIHGVKERALKAEAELAKRVLAEYLEGKGG